MQNGNPILKSVRAALEREPLINLHRWPIQLDLADDHALILEGEVGSVAAKKRALEIAGAAPDVRGLVDRLHVAPAERKGDGAILDVLESLLLDARELTNCTLRVVKKGQTVTLQEAAGEDASGDILVSVRDGVVTLDGWAISLSHKRMVGVLAWWVPGCRDVVDALEVLPPEQDNDDEVSDALSLVLEMDPMIPHPEQIRVHTHNYVVTLDGLVATQTEKDRAEQDAWCLFAVDKVINQLAVSR
ncbi:MAG: BON domain-containing protein [Gammaproteobacteria bacterium]|nr:BON domain-containing protein [Gammaproteobacteria bacterium]MBU1408899.1 BON domain-containing protein [Gammaproteobacteria bacterium]MBU1532736.1 BON domain-containing protein [Gammaproteobacteria bacterium]